MFYKNNTFLELPVVDADAVKREGVFDYNECKDEMVYKMNKSTRGYCLIIHMEKNRKMGNSEDVTKLRKLFESLQFCVKDYCDLTKAEIEQLTKNVKEASHKWSCCFVMFILAHGGTDEDGSAYFITSDDEVQRMVNGKHKTFYIKHKVSDIKNEIENHPDLVGKPKLLFLQTCRGGKQDVIVDKDDDLSKKPEEFEPGIKGFIPTGSDFLLCFPTIEKYVAYRDKNGSRFIQRLCEVFNDYHKICDVVSMMTLVTKSVADITIDTKVNGVKAKQNPATTSTFRKFLFFGEPPSDPTPVWSKRKAKWDSDDEETSNTN